MKNLLMSAVLLVVLLVGTAPPAHAVVRTRTPQQTARYLRHKRRLRTAKRIGIGAAGGAAVGALAAGPPGAIVGGVAGAGAGWLYDQHKRHHRRRR